MHELIDVALKPYRNQKKSRGQECMNSLLLLCLLLEIERETKNAKFEINIINQDKELVAYFKGDVYISSKKWDLEQMN